MQGAVVDRTRGGGPDARTRVRAALSVVRHQWRPVVVPTFVLWLLAALVSVELLHPGDVTEFAQYAHGALAPPLLHRFPLEYPAPALAIFLLPLLLPLSYPWAFAIATGVVVVLLAMSYDTSGLPDVDLRAAGRLIIYLALGAVMVLAGRYDIFAVACAFWALRAARQGRWSAAWTWSSIGFVVKLFPAVFWPALLIAEWRQTRRVPWRRAGWMASSLVLIAGVPALLSRSATLNVLHYYTRRPSEIGSLSSGLSLLLDWHGTTWVQSFHSSNVVSAVTGPLAVVLEALAVAGCCWVWRAQLRGRLPIEAACLATLTLVVLGSKVLSVQYVMWLMPLWALYRLRITWLLASLANLVIFPSAAAARGFSVLPSHSYAVALTLSFFARDVLIAGGTAMWIRTVLVSPHDDPAALSLAPRPG